MRREGRGRVGGGEGRDDWSGGSGGERRGVRTFAPHHVGLCGRWASIPRCYRKRRTCRSRAYATLTLIFSSILLEEGVNNGESIGREGRMRERNAHRREKVRMHKPPTVRETCVRAQLSRSRQGVREPCARAKDLADALDALDLGEEGLLRRKL